MCFAGMTSCTQDHDIQQRKKKRKKFFKKVLIISGVALVGYVLVKLIKKNNVLENDLNEQKQKNFELENTITDLQERVGHIEDMRVEKHIAVTQMFAEYDIHIDSEHKALAELFSMVQTAIGSTFLLDERLETLERTAVIKKPKNRRC